MEKVFKEIEKELNEDIPGRVNSMLAPHVVEWDDEKKSSKIRFEKKEWELNQRDELHGGAISSMMDVSMGMTTAAFVGDDVTTSDLSLSFIRPFLGNSFVVETEIVHPGKTFVRLESKAYDEDTGKLLATASGVFFRLK